MKVQEIIQTLMKAKTFEEVEREIKEKILSFIIEEDEISIVCVLPDGFFYGVMIWKWLTNKFGEKRVNLTYIDKAGNFFDGEKVRARKILVVDNDIISADTYYKIKERLLNEDSIKSFKYAVLEDKGDKDLADIIFGNDFASIFIGRCKRCRELFPKYMEKNEAVYHNYCSGCRLRARKDLSPIIRIFRGNRQHSLSFDELYEKVNTPIFRLGKLKLQKYLEDNPQLFQREGSLYRMVK